MLLLQDRALYTCAGAAAADGGAAAGGAGAGAGAGVEGVHGEGCAEVPGDKALRLSFTRARGPSMEWMAFCRAASCRQCGWNGGAAHRHGVCGCVP